MREEQKAFDPQQKDCPIFLSPISNGSHLFYLFVKNQVAESHGILGHFMEFTISNTDTTPTELFAVESEVMKSYP